MERTEVKKKIKKILVEELKIPGIQPENITDDEPLFGESGGASEGLGLDSLDAVELVVLLQKHFNVHVETAEEGQKAFVSVNALADYILAHRK